MLQLILMTIALALGILGLLGLMACFIISAVGKLATRSDLTAVGHHLEQKELIEQGSKVCHQKREIQLFELEQKIKKNLKQIHEKIDYLISLQEGS